MLDTERGTQAENRWNHIKLLMNVNIDKIILLDISKKTMCLNITDPRVQSISYTCCEAENGTGTEPRNGGC